MACFVSYVLFKNIKIYQIKEPLSKFKDQSTIFSRFQTLTSEQQASLSVSLKCDVFRVKPNLAEAHWGRFAVLRLLTERDWHVSMAQHVAYLVPAIPKRLRYGYYNTITICKTYFVPLFGRFLFASTSCEI